MEKILKIRHRKCLEKYCLQSWFAKPSRSTDPPKRQILSDINIQQTDIFTYQIW